jgi:hypothetical protein
MVTCVGRFISDREPRYPLVFEAGSRPVRSEMTKLKCSVCTGFPARNVSTKLTYWIYLLPSTQQTSKSKKMDTLEKFYIYRETEANNQINKLTVQNNAIFKIFIFAYTISRCVSQLNVNVFVISVRTQVA